MYPHPDSEVFGPRADGPRRRRTPPGVHRKSRCGRRRDEGGQALIEFALVLPLVVLLMGVAFNGWNGMQLSIRLTSAARAGALKAANDLATNPSLTQSQVLADATNAVNQEEATSIYQDTNSMASNYVSMATPQDTTNGVTINVVTISISNTSVTLVPFVRNIAVTANASARYS